MPYPLREPNIPDQYDPEVVAHCARVGAELGADIVKVPYTGSPETFRREIRPHGRGGFQNSTWRLRVTRRKLQFVYV